MVHRVKLSALMVTGLLLTAGFGKSAQGQDTDPLCYFTDAAGNRRDLSAWCGRSGNGLTSPTSAPASVPMGPPPEATSANGGGNVELLQCRVQAERRTEQASPSQRLIVHLMGSVQNRTGKPVSNVTVRYVVKSEASILSRDGRSLNESLLGIGDRGTFDRKDKPIALEAVTSSDNRWRIEVEGIDWVEAGMARSRQLSPPTRCY
ncbi:MAG: hypothetical protein ACAF42_08530 [Limnothrix sp. BL-A-16]